MHRITSTRLHHSRPCLSVAFAKKDFHGRSRYQLVNHQIPHCLSSLPPVGSPWESALSSCKVCNVSRSIRNRSVKLVPSEAKRACEMIERETEGGCAFDLG